MMNHALILMKPQTMQTQKKELFILVYSTLIRFQNYSFFILKIIFSTLKDIANVLKRIEIMLEI